MQISQLQVIRSYQALLRIPVLITTIIVTLSLTLSQQVVGLYPSLGSSCTFCEQVVFINLILGLAVKREKSGCVEAKRKTKKGMGPRL